MNLGGPPADTAAMQPQEQPASAPPVYYVPVHAAPMPAPAPTAEAWTETPGWVRTLEDRLSMHSVVLALIALMVLGNLILTFVLLTTINHALHPFG